MADSLLSTQVGATAWVVAGGMTIWCARKLNKDGPENHKAPLMGVLGAFVFAAQMVNFSIPGTGASGHLGGGMLLTMLLGPHAALLVISSVLVVQALFFADGGLLALGCNIINLGVIPCFIAWPLVARPILGDGRIAWRVGAASFVGSIIALQLGALGVVVETTASGISELPVGAFALVILPIHLAIGVVEGAVTVGAVFAARRMHPGLLDPANEPDNAGLRSRVWGFLGAAMLLAILTASFLSLLASESPDGLEWSLAKATGEETLSAPDSSIHKALDTAQGKVALMPDYALPGGEGRKSIVPGTSVAGIAGAFATLALAGLAGMMIHRRKRGAPS